MKTDPWAEQKRSYWVRSEVDAIPNNEVQASWVRGTVVDLIEELEQENGALRRVARAAHPILGSNLTEFAKRGGFERLEKTLARIEQLAPWLLEE